MRRRALALAAVAATAYAGLGLAVSHAPPGELDRAGRAFAGEAPDLAVVFTASCWWPVLVSAGAVALVLAALVPAWRRRAIVAVVVTLVGWQTSDLLKALFGRPRPEYWTRIHETSAAYSSGHAMFAVIVYGLWGSYLLRSALPRAARIAGAAACWCWAVAILWSRLALGAHYVTDLIGGVLFGTALLALAAALPAVRPTVRSGPSASGPR